MSQFKQHSNKNNYYMYNDPATGNALGGRHLCTVNPTAGTTTMVGLFGNSLTGRGTWMSDLTFDANGTLYGIIGDGGVGDPQTMYTIDLTTAQITAVVWAARRIAATMSRSDSSR